MRRRHGVPRKVRAEEAGRGSVRATGGLPGLCRKRRSTARGGRGLKTPRNRLCQGDASGGASPFFCARDWCAAQGRALPRREERRKPSPCRAFRHAAAFLRQTGAVRGAAGGIGKVCPGAFFEVDGNGGQQEKRPSNACPLEGKEERCHTPQQILCFQAVATGEGRWKRRRNGKIQQHY